MSDIPQEHCGPHWSACLGFTQLFRAFRLAIQPTKLLLAFCGIVLTYGTGRILDGMWSTASRPALIVMGDHALSELDVFVNAEGGGREAVLAWRETLESAEGVQRIGLFKLLLTHGRVSIRQTTDAVVAADCGGLVAAIRFGLMGPAWLFAMHWFYGVLFFLVSLAIWAVFGGAICRVTAMHATRDEVIGLGESLAFAKRKFLSFLAAPLMPLAVLVFVGVLLLLGGLVGAIPAVGEIFVGMTFFLALIGGAVMAFVAIGWLAGFSLTFPTVAVEGSDAFDAVSRSFSYIYARPWRSAFYALVSLAYGAICLVFVKFFVRIALFAVHLCVGLTMNLGSPYGAEDTGKLDAMWQGPLLMGESAFWGGFGDYDLAHLSAFGHFWYYLWIFTVVGVVGAFVVSFYYSASTLIYLLLRREVDATDLEDVYLEEQPEDESLMPQTPMPESTAPVSPTPEAPAPEAPAPEPAPGPEQEEPDDTTSPDIGQTP